MTKLSDMKNIGKILEAQLIEVGINTPEELCKIGSMGAWARIKKIDDSACINRLMALEGAIRDIDKKYLLESEKAELKAFYNENK